MASNKFYVDIDGGDVNALINWKHNPLSTAQRAILGSTLDASNVGLFVFDTNLLQGFYWTGTDWIVSGGGGVIVSWGNITGVLSNQSDLQNALNLKANISSLANVAFSGNYSDLNSKPTVLSDFINDEGFITGITGADVISALGYVPVPPSILITATGNGIQGGGSLAANRTISLDFTYLDSRYASAGSGVLSFNARSGAVTPQVGDYSSFYYPLSSNPAGYLTAAILTADNGLTLTGSEVQLGGSLIQNTAIALNNNYFRFTSVAGGVIGFTENPSDGTLSGTLTTGVDGAGNDATLVLNSTGFFGTLTDGVNTTLLFLQAGQFQIDTPQFSFSGNQSTFISPVNVFQGDVYIQNGNQAAGYVLFSDINGKGTWMPLPSSPPLSVVTKVANYLATTADDVILVDASGGDVTITLYTAVGAVKELTVKKIDSSANSVTIVPNGSEKIDQSSTVPIFVQDVSVSIVSDNTNWFII